MKHVCSTNFYLIKLIATSRPSHILLTFLISIVKSIQSVLNILIVLSLLVSLGIDKTVIFVTHQLEALQYADRIVVLKNGAVATEGPTFQILNEIAAGCSQFEYKPYKQVVDF